MHRLVPLSLLTTTLLGCSSDALDSPDQPATADDSPKIEIVMLREVYRPNAKVPLSATALAFNPTYTTSSNRISGETYDSDGNLKNR